MVILTLKKEVPRSNPIKLAALTVLFSKAHNVTRMTEYVFSLI